MLTVRSRDPEDHLLWEYPGIPKLGESLEQWDMYSCQRRP